MESRTQKPSCSSPVRASARFRRRAVGVGAHEAHERDGRRQGDQRQQQPRRGRGRSAGQLADRPRQRRGQERAVDHQPEHRPCPRAAEAHGQRALARAAVGLDVAHVVDHEDRRGEQADWHGEHERLPADLLGLHVVRAGHRHEPEEQEHEDLAQALVAVGPRPAGVEHAGQDRGGADGQQHRPGQRDQVGAAQHGQREAHVGGDEHLTRGHEAAGGHAHGPEAVVGVGAAARVGVVVGQVRADLDEDRAEQRGDEPADAQVDHRHGQRRAHEHRRDGGGQRPRPRRHEPDAHRGRPRYGRRGNLEKSGRRLST